MLIGGIRVRKIEKSIITLLIIISALILLVSCKENSHINYQSINSYINETTYKELSFNELGNRLGIVEPSTYINSLNYSIDKNDYINSLDIEYVVNKNKNKFAFIYRRDADICKVMKVSKRSNDAKVIANEVNPLVLIDDNLKTVSFNKELYKYYNIILDTSVSTTYNIHSGKAYLNGIQLTDRSEDNIKVEGIMFTGYGIPWYSGENLTYYIFTGNDN